MASNPARRATYRGSEYARMFFLPNLGLPYPAFMVKSRQVSRQGCLSRLYGAGSFVRVKPPTMRPKTQARPLSLTQSLWFL